MKFSILIAHYNNWEYFQTCYLSIQKQTFKNYEIIILDDCSSDDSFKKLQKLASNDSKIKLYKNEINQGVGFTKAKLIELAQGEIIGFLDPDDALYESALEISVKHHVENENLVATYSRIMMCNNELKPCNIYPRTRSIKNLNKYFFNINNEVSHFFTFKRNAYFKTIGINSELTSSVDFDLYLKLFEKGDFEFINQPLYYYRQHAKGVSQDVKRKKIIYQNWNKVLWDTCQRRKITQIGNQYIFENSDLAKIIFENENSYLKKIKRRLNLS